MRTGVAICYQQGLLTEEIIGVCFAILKVIFFSDQRIFKVKITEEKLKDILNLVNKTYSGYTQQCKQYVES